MKKISLTLLLMGAAFLLKAQKVQPVFADSLVKKLTPGYFNINPKNGLQLQQPQVSIENSLKNINAQNLFATNLIVDRMPVVVLDGNSKMPVVKLDGNDNMPVKHIDIIDPASMPLKATPTLIIKAP